MAYIIKNTSGLVNTRVTDIGRQKLSQGNFKISYFQIGDSEISYDKIPQNYNQSNSFVLEPQFNSQNAAGVPQSNRQYVKYPYLVDEAQTNIYGIPYMDSLIESVFNRAPLRGFFTGDTTQGIINWDLLTNDKYVVSANYIVNTATLNGSNQIEIIYSGTNTSNLQTPQIGDIITIYYDGKAKNNVECFNLPTPTPTPSISSSPTTATTTTTTTIVDCASPTPTPTPSKTPCLTPTPSPQCPLPPYPDCFMGMNSCTIMLTYRIIDVCKNTLTLDRPTPDYRFFPSDCYSRVIIYPSNMTQIYDSITPEPHWNDQVIDFESICDTDQFDVKIWNMNIPWTENPAGIIETQYEGYQNSLSIDYIGSKEYFGYNSSEGQTDTSATFYYNSLGDIVTTKPEDQKAIAIIHYTNQTIDFFYGEKFALEPYNPSNPSDTTGQARNFKLHIPWLMWHKNPNCCNGQTFWVDPPGFDDKDLFKPYYIKSTRNETMNQPGIRYYHLWDTNKNNDGLPNRIGKVFPDSKLVIIDDDEIIAAMSYKANRNWTLPAPQLSLLTPNTCDTTTSQFGILTGSNQTMYVTYRLTNKFGFTNSLHCNYYVKIQGNNNECNPDTTKNVAIRFGEEFGCLIQPGYSPVTTTTTYYPVTTTSTTYPCYGCELPDGYFGDEFQVLAQIVATGERPDPTKWKIIDFTSQISNNFINGYITQESIVNSTFVITNENYQAAPYYNLNDYIPLTPLNTTTKKLNFGDEFYFYGAIETDIQATIYEMKYKINLSSNEFQVSTNPSWTLGTPSYITEIALLDDNKDILVMSKLQSPTLRQGIQQYVVKIDF